MIWKMPHNIWFFKMSLLSTECFPQNGTKFKSISTQFASLHQHLPHCRLSSSRTWLSVLEDLFKIKSSHSSNLLTSWDKSLLASISITCEKFHWVKKLPQIISLTYRRLAEFLYESRSDELLMQVMQILQVAHADRLFFRAIPLLNPLESSFWCGVQINYWIYSQWILHSRVNFVK